MARRVQEVMERDSEAAAIDNINPRVVGTDTPMSQRGVRGGYGVLIMPGATQIFKDNYFSNQTADQALGAPWTGNNDLARIENPFLGDNSVELDGLNADADAYQIYQTTDDMVVSAYFFAPPPFNLATFKFYTGDADAIVAPDGIISLGEYKYFAYLAATGQNAVDDRWGVLIDNSFNPHGLIWVDCLSLTATLAPLAFIPNDQAGDPITSEDDVFKLTLDEPLPQSGTFDFVFMPYWVNTNKAVDASPVLFCFLSSGGNTGSNDYVMFQIDDTNSNGIFVEASIAGGEKGTTNSDGYAATGFKAFEAMQVTVIWDFSDGGSKLIRIYINGDLKVSSDNIVDWPTTLTDIWVGVERSGSTTFTNHIQGLLQDASTFRRMA